MIGLVVNRPLGLTTQVPVRSVYLTSWRSRKMHLCEQVVELRHAPRWQLAPANRPAGQAVRALACLGPEKGGCRAENIEAEDAARCVRRTGRRRAAASDMARAERRKGGL